MDNVKEKAFEYISDQLRIFVINRLAQSPSSSQQLATSFSILVDDLIVTESSLDHILDALVKAHIVEFDDVNGVRMYYLMRFDGDNIFELDLEAVERLIVENDIPYYENTIPANNDDLYFEYVDDKICIHLNRPIEIPEMPIDEADLETEDDSISVSENNTDINELESDNSYSESVDNTSSNEEIDEENNEFEAVDQSNENDLLDNQNAEDNDQSDDTFNASSYVEDREDNEVIQVECNQEVDIEEASNDNIEIESIENEDNCVDSKEDIEQLGINSNDLEAVNASVNEIESDYRESLNDNENDNINTEELKKAISEDIDFSSPIESVSYSTNNSVSDDFFNSYFADYLPKDSKETINKVVEYPVKNETTEVSSNETNEIIENVSKNNDDMITFDDSIGDNIVFTSDVYTEPSVTTPEEDSKRIEEALRKLNEYAKPQEKNEEVEAPLEVSSKSDDIEFYDVSINDLIRESEVKSIEVKEEIKPEESEKTVTPHLSVKAYIEEQELINNYDWEKKLSRVFVDSGKDLEEEVNNTENNVIVSTYSELKDIMEKKNYKFKAYSNYDSVSFYSQNYVFSNRINKSTAIYTYLFMLIEIIIGYLFVDKYINKGLMPYLVLAIGLLVIPVVFILKNVYFKDKRKPANFHFSISFVTALMLYANLMVMVVLLAFFVPSLNVSINNLSSMITTIFYPAGLLSSIPFSVCVYSILYNSKKYHLH